MIELNNQQQRAALVYTGIASIIAVPGSGKTLTMTHRISNLVQKHGVAPECILGLTFTRNAAKAMNIKLAVVLNSQADKVNLSTIHSFCYWFLKHEGIIFELLNGSSQIVFIRKIMKHHKSVMHSPGMILGQIALAKSNLISVDEFRILYESDSTMKVIADIYEDYEDQKKQNKLLDFSDLLTETYHILSNSIDVREKYQNSYRHILVDEFQDVTPVQMAILKLLADHPDKLDSSFWVCGDDWQSIYSFAGSSVGNILNFQNYFQDSRMYVLETNYRSTPQILAACQSLIGFNVKKIEKTLKPSRCDGENVLVLNGKDEEDEAFQIVNEVKDLIERRKVKTSDIAVLYRANCQSRAVEEAFSLHGIPYHIENGLNFYQRFEVKILLDYMRLIVNPDSDAGDEALRSVINIPNRYIGKKFMADLTGFANARETPLYAALKSMPVDVAYLRKGIKEFTNFIDPLIQDAENLEPADLIHILREGLDYDSFIADDDLPSPDDNKIANINQLQMAALQYEDIPALLEYTDTFRDDASNDKNGVSLMTIHKSKGLEFPVVFVIGFMEGLLPNTNADIEEERRIAFVGISRAMNLLYVSYAEKFMGKEAQVSPFIEEMEVKE